MIGAVLIVVPAHDEELLLPADESLVDIDDVVGPAPVDDDEEDAPVGALEDIDLEIEE